VWQAEAFVEGGDGEKTVTSLNKRGWGRCYETMKRKGGFHVRGRRKQKKVERGEGMGKTISKNQKKKDPSTKRTVNRQLIID